MGLLAHFQALLPVWDLDASDRLLGAVGDGQGGLQARVQHLHVLLVRPLPHHAGLRVDGKLAAPRGEGAVRHGVLGSDPDPGLEDLWPALCHHRGDPHAAQRGVVREVLPEEVAVPELLLHDPLVRLVHGPLEVRVVHNFDHLGTHRLLLVGRLHEERHVLWLQVLDVLRRQGSGAGKPDLLAHPVEGELVLNLAVVGGVVHVDQVVGRPDEEGVHTVHVDQAEVDDRLGQDPDRPLAPRPVLYDGVHEAVDPAQGQAHGAHDAHAPALHESQQREDGKEEPAHDRHDEDEAALEQSLERARPLPDAAVELPHDLAR
mmetsp:Transcript_557/g.1614  ORF Transcript_557/g.1614 Transcript_557/m.1614 type:complete len:317 (+) Transcript_557:585-1535(+)